MRAARRLAAAVTSTVLLVTLAAAGSAPAASEGEDPNAVQVTDSTVTVGWRDEGQPARDTTDPDYASFADLKVTVSQTEDLISQAVDVTWTGARTSEPSGLPGRHFLQIMQCWGHQPSGPDRTQCQFGATGSLAYFPAGGPSWAASRSVVDVVQDPAELPQDPDRVASAGFGLAVVDFEAASGERVGPEAIVSNSFYSSATTNEVVAATTDSTGNGGVVLEVQTAQEANGFDCGNPVVGGAAGGQGCWLVVVPRGEYDPDGARSVDIRPVRSSPLSASNWADRIQVPLGFQPLTDACPIGAEERLTVGGEPVTEAISSWQPVLCQETGSVYGFSQTPDSEARRQVVADVEGAPGLGFTTGPVLPDQARGADVGYAPVAVAGLAIGLNIQVNPLPADHPRIPADLRERCAALARGSQVRGEVRFTPRLLAKLLTYSYEGEIGIWRPRQLAANPGGLTTDPEFLALNRDFWCQASTPTEEHLVVSAEGSDATLALWEYVTSDPEARAWLDGADDGFGVDGKPGMTVNPAYRGIQLPLETVPLAEQYCGLGSGVYARDGAGADVIDGSTVQPGQALTVRVVRPLQDGDLTGQLGRVELRFTGGSGVPEVMQSTPWTWGPADTDGYFAFELPFTVPSAVGTYTMSTNIGGGSSVGDLALVVGGPPRTARATPASPLCATDYFAQAGDMHAAASAVRRGASLRRTAWDLQQKPFPVYKEEPRQTVGRQGLYAVADTASSARYGLQVASLRTATGEFVAPTATSLSAGAAAFVDSTVEGVQRSDPLTRSPGAYPLTLPVYAAATPSLQDDAANADYAELIRYAVTDGQEPGLEPGQLPPGYGQLTAEQRSTALAVADWIEAGGDGDAPTEPPVSAGETGGGGQQASPVPPERTSPVASSVDPPARTPVQGPPAAAASPAAAPVPPPAAAATPVDLTEEAELAASRTPDDPLGWLRFVLFAALTVGLVAAGLGPLLVRLSRRRAEGVS